MGKAGIAQAQYGDLPDCQLVIYVDGRPYPCQRVNILDLYDWRIKHRLRRVGPVGGPNIWPPAILYERIDDHDDR